MLPAQGKLTFSTVLAICTGYFFDPRLGKTYISHHACYFISVFLAFPEVRLTLPPCAQPQRKAGANREYSGAFVTHVSHSSGPFSWRLASCTARWHEEKQGEILPTGSLTKTSDCLHYVGWWWHHRIIVSIEIKPGCVK